MNYYITPDEYDTAAQNGTSKQTLYDREEEGDDKMDLLRLMKNVRQGDLTPEEACNIVQEDLVEMLERERLQGYAEGAADRLAHQAAVDAARLMEVDRLDE